MLTLATAAAPAAAKAATGGILAMIGAGLIYGGMILLVILFLVGWFWLCKEAPIAAALIIFFQSLGN